MQNVDVLGNASAQFPINIEGNWESQSPGEIKDEIFQAG